MISIEDYGSERVITKLFDIAIECEYGATKLYKKFAFLFSHVPEVSSFRKDLQNDEIKHARILQHSRSTLTSTQLLESPSEKIWRTRVQAQDNIITTNHTSPEQP